MIFLALAAPIPGTATSSASVAVLRSTGEAGACLPEDFFLAAGAVAVDAAWPRAIVGAETSRPAARRNDAARIRVFMGPTG